MRIEIFDVGHGSAALAVADNQNLLLMDCGHDNNFCLSQHLPQRWRAVQQLIVSHYDSDHVSGLADVRASIPIQRMLSNPTVPLSEIRRLKELEGPLRAGMKALLEMKSSFGPIQVNNEPDFAGMTFTCFYNSYPAFTDINNLSVVTFIRYDGLSVVFPGDIEREGWLELLTNVYFQQCLREVNVFVASHHGRENGYCKEVFNFCYPDIIIISDKDIQHTTQEHCYDLHARGMNFTRGRRYVLTTRSDGHIVIEKQKGVNEYTVSIA